MKMKHGLTNKIRPPWRYLILFLLLLALLFFLLGWLADDWLESPGGRKKLQRELSQRLGLPVALKGEYGLKFLPRLKIAGSALELGRQGGNQVFISSKDFSAELEIVPLIRQELRIAAIDLHDGFIDLALLPGRGKETELRGASSAETFISLPHVASLSLSNFSILYGSASDRIDLSELKLTDFRAGVPSDLVIVAELFQGETARVEATMRGNITVDAADLSSELNISHLKIALGETVIDGLSGIWRWERSLASLQGRLEWADAVRSASLQLGISLGDPVSGSLRGSYREPALDRPLELEVFFKLSGDSTVLEAVKIYLGEQAIRGSGCLRFTDRPGLHLALMADELDLDQLKPLLSAGQGGEGDILPALAIRLRVETARIEGAVADDVLVEAGGEPDCPNAENLAP